MTEIDLYDDFDDDVAAESPEDILEGIDEAFEVEDSQAQHTRRKLPDQPIFQTLFMQSVSDDDPVLLDFAQHVIGRLCEVFGLSSAKGGAFFRIGQQKGHNVEHVKYDQTMRAHLLNGMLPALHIARQLNKWGGASLRDWDETTERLFIAGYILHDYTKIEAIKVHLEQVGLRDFDLLREEQISTLESIVEDWCRSLGLDTFLAPISGVDEYLHELIFIIHNTQQYKGTLNASPVLNRLHRFKPDYQTAALVSCLADLMAYSHDGNTNIHTPRALVASKAINRIIQKLTDDPDHIGRPIARLTYHHIAENRGILLNFIHNATLEALTTGDAEGQRIPLLFAPSGVVYLEHRDAPTLPDPALLVTEIVKNIREKAAQKLIQTGKGAKRGNVSVQVDDSYNDFFDLREFVQGSVNLVINLVRNNKSTDRLAAIRDNGWPCSNNMPTLLVDAKDARLDRLAEWIKLIETIFEARYQTDGFADWVFDQLQINDLRTEFETLRNHPAAKSADGGLKRWWFWAAGHGLARQPNAGQDYQLITWLESLAANLAASLPEELPESAQINQATWDELIDYIGRVLTLGGAKALDTVPGQDITRHIRAKGGRGGSACAICGSEYHTRKPTETAVAFQPGVYSARIKLGSSDNKRSLCTLCSLEQLLRQMFVNNLDSGGTAESQRVRYLSFYPTYFFTPETLQLMRRVYGLIKDIRLSDKDLLPLLRNGAENLIQATFWQRLEHFMLRAPEDEPSRRVQYYSDTTEPTFLTVGLRNFNDPTDSESWVLPTFLALVLSVCLDVKVVVSESGVPLMLEADELPETIWFDGVHAAMQALMVENNAESTSLAKWKLTPNQGGRLRTDDILPSLARLTAAYVIHLDTEYDPPKENWQRFGPIAHSLAESPLYVFHYLQKQVHDGKRISANQVRHYISYADTLFNNGGNDMHRARELVRLYSQFYRVNRPFEASSYTLLRPLDIVADTLLRADPRLFTDEQELIDVARGQLKDRMESSETSAVFIRGRESEEAMQQFCTFFVHDIFLGAFNGDVAALRGKQLNLLRSACEVLYLDLQRERWAQRQQESDTATS